MGGGGREREREGERERERLCSCVFCAYQFMNRLVGLVVKASASGVEDPGFESSLRWNFSGSSHYQ